MPLHPLVKRAREFAVHQKPFELSSLLDLLEQQELHTVVEIGTKFGGTLLCWCRLAEPDALVLSIDLGKAECSPERLEEMRLLFPQAQQKLHLLRKNSHDPSTLEDVEKHLGGRQVDFLFLDGDHTYEGVKQDFEMYGPLVKEGGLIVFHDILEHTNQPECRVSDLWGEIKHSYRHLELTTKPVHWGGIGVLWQRDTAGDGNGTLRAGLQAAIPYNNHVGLEYVEVSDGRGVVSLPDADNLKNHVGSQHAGALFSAGEAASGGAFVGAFAERMGDITPLAKSAEISYLKLARGPITATATLSEDKQTLVGRLESEGRVEFPVTVVLTDDQGTTVAEMTVHWHVRKN